MKRYLLPTLLLLIFVLTGCQKVPMASFTTDKEEYVSGDVINVTNVSKDAYSQKWIVYTGSSIAANYSTENPTIIISDPGSYLITLTCYSKNGKVTSRYSKSISITKAVSYAFYTYNTISTLLPVKLYIDNVYVGSLNQNSVNPYCGAFDCLTVNIEPGIHEFKTTFASVGGTHSHNETVLESNSCVPYQLY